MPYDPLHALRTLQEFDVRFVVIGGIAGRLWGSPTMTNDTDVCYARDTANLERMAEALQSLHARFRGVDEEVPFLLDARTLADGQNFTFTTDDGPLDVLGLPSGVEGFEELSRNAVEFEVGEGLRLPVCDLEDLIRMKRAAGRRKDQIELEVLAAVRDELQNGSGDPED
jgi:hypothetical protein